MPTNITLPTAPFRSSNLAQPPSPFSPRLPITPPASPPTKTKPPTTRTLATSPPKGAHADHLSTKSSTPPPPPRPLPWLWQCHLCSRVYPLGVTRRCLDDGHAFCAGSTTLKRNRRTGGKRTVRHKACASEFDYHGWKCWGVWRRTVAEQVAAAAALAGDDATDDEEDADSDAWMQHDSPTSPPLPLFPPKTREEAQWLSGVWAKKRAPTHRLTSEVAAKQYWRKECWRGCDYPSECRWGKQFGVSTPAAMATVKTSFEEIFADTPDAPAASDVTDATTTLETATDAADGTPMPDALDHTHTHTQPSTAAALAAAAVVETPSGALSPPEEPTRKPSMDDVLASAKRRKRLSGGQGPSPLALTAPESITPAVSSGSETASSAEQAKGEAVAVAGHSRTFQRAFDELDMDIRKSFERVGDVWTGFVEGMQGHGREERRERRALAGV